MTHGRAGRLVLAIAIAGGAATFTHAQQSRFPPRLDEYLKNHVRLTEAERTSLGAGAPVTKLLDADPAAEVAVFGAVWVAAPPDLYVRAVTDIESFERGGSFKVTKKISEPARLEDFAALDLPDDDVEDLKSCKPGNCQLKVSQNGLDRLRKEVNWSKPSARADAERLVRQLALEYVTAYREGGNARLAVYRDAARPTFVAAEFESLVNRMPELTTYLPELRRYLLEYPKYSLPASASFLYWQEAAFGLKPTIRINHVVVAERTEGIAVASKQLYASHYFWTALELRVLVADPSRGQGFWFVTINRSRSDGLGGFVGRMVRGKVRGEATSGMQAVLKVTKTNLEQQARSSGSSRLEPGPGVRRR
jgi:hypothetical protein